MENIEKCETPYDLFCNLRELFDPRLIIKLKVQSPPDDDINLYNSFIVLLSRLRELELLLSRVRYESD